MTGTSLLRTAVIAVALAVVGIPAGAQYGMPQYTHSGVQTIDYYVQGPPFNISCFSDSRYLVTSTSASCPTQATSFGTMAALASADLLTRTVRTAARLTDNGTDTTTILYAGARSTMGNSLTLNGGTGAHDYLLFRFMTNDPGWAIVAGDPVHGHGSVVHEFWLYFTGGAGGHYGRDEAFDGPYGSHESILAGTTHTAGTVSVLFDFFAVPGMFRYEFSTETVLRLRDGQYQPRVFDEFGAFDATLAGIDLLDAAGGALATATFDQFGNAALDAGVVAPEPVTASLFATGLLGIGVVIRRRRCRAEPA